MKKIVPFVTATLLTASVCAALVPEVSGVSFSQPSGTRLVTIRYTLTGGPAIVTVDIRTNGVSIGAANFANVEGDVNRKVTGDTEHVITWRPDRSWPNLEISGGVDAVVSAWSLDAPPDYMVAELDGSGALRYYTCAEALPGGLLSNRVYRTTSLVMRRIHAKGIPWTMRGGNYPHTVILTNDYYIGVFEITQGQYLTANNGSYWASSFFTYGPDRDLRPVDNVSYGNLRDYDGHYWPAPPGNILGTMGALTGLAIDLPSEAQWEFAARAGYAEGRWGDGSGISGNDTDANLDRLGRYKNSTGITAFYNVDPKATAATPAVDGGTAIVGSYAPNDWGLYDMCGNVREWVLDGWDSNDVVKNFGGAVNIDPNSENHSKTLNGSSSYTRVLKGGGWEDGASNCRPSWRGQRLQSNPDKDVGFRVVCPVVVP